MIRYQYKNSKILFIGINPHPGSFNRAIPFSNNKMFWYLLSSAGLINESREELKDDSNLLKIYKEKFNKVYKLGLVNIIDRPTVDITFIKKGEEVKGRRNINRIIKSQKPKVVCFIGKVSYEKYIGSKKVDFGWQENIYESKAHVMHFPLRGRADIRIEELKIVSKIAKV